MESLQKLQAENGGRPAANDDFLVLQSQALVLGTPALLAGLGPCIVSGCRVYQTGTVWNVDPGMVWDGSQLLPFLGQSNVKLPLMFQSGAEQVVDERAYQTGGTKTTIKSQAMELVAIVATAPNLIVDTYGALTIWHRMQQQTRSVKQVEWLAGLTPANYDTDGLGKPGTEAWGWGLCNGAGGRADLRGRFVVGQDDNTADYNTVGNVGGEASHTLTVSELPPHNHSSEFKITDSRTGDTSQFTAGWTSTPNAQGKNITTNNTGSGQPHENRPPFYVLAARQWVGY